MSGGRREGGPDIIARWAIPLAALSAAWAGAPDAARVRVAVVARNPADWRALGLARATLARVAQLGPVWPANPATAQRLVPTGADASPAKVAAAGSRLSCQFVAVLDVRGRGEAGIELTETASAAQQPLGARGALHELPGQLALALADAMGLAVSPGERAKVSEPHPATEAAAEALWQGDAARTPEEQVRLYEAGLTSDPASPLLHNHLGAALARAGQPERALAEFDRAITLAPDYAAPHTNRGLVLKQAKRWKEAEEALRTAIALEPKSATPHIALARLLDRVGNIIEAVSELERAVEADPCQADALMTLADFYFESYDLRAARRTAERLLGVEPDHVGALNLVGLIQLVPRDYEEAEASFLRALTAKPDDAETLSNLALALYGQGQKEAAIGVLERVLAREPNYANAHLYLGRIYLAEKRADEAAAALQRAAELRPAMLAARQSLQSARSAAEASRRTGCGCLGIENPIGPLAAGDVAAPLLPMALLLAPHARRLARRRPRRAAAAASHRM